MTTFHEILERLTPPPLPVMYHYTTQAGLLGIVQKREIWATHTQYLNDTREFTHASQLVLDAIRCKLVQESSISARNTLDQMAESIQGHETINICVASFSSSADSLSQWRAYGGSAGFCCGFEARNLSAWASEEKFKLAQCIYNESEQRGLIELLIDVVYEEIAAWKPQFEGDDPIPGGNLAAYLNQVAPAMKDPAFSDEKEWRLISRPLMSSLERFGYREGKSMLVPYYRLPLETETCPFDLHSVIVGPTPHINQSVRAVRGLLVRHKIKRRDLNAVKPSLIPYRNW